MCKSKKESSPVLINQGTILIIIVFIIAAMMPISCIQTYEENRSRHYGDSPHSFQRGERMDPTNLEDYLYQRNYVRRMGTRDVYDNRFTGHSVRCCDAEIGPWGNRRNCCGIDQRGNCIPGSEFVIGERLFDPDQRVKEYKPR